MQAPSFRQRIHYALEVHEADAGAIRWVDYALILLIALNIVAVTVETIEPVYLRYGPWFDAFNLFSVAVFTIEYLARIWSCVEDRSYGAGWRGRLRYMATPMAVIDLLAILPFYLGQIFGIDLRFLRALRLLRVFKLTRYYRAMTVLLNVLREESTTLFAGFFILLLLLILSSSGAYLFEHRAQPEAFGSVPKAMWWAIVTLTTVGYGDVVPITPMGRVFGALVTVVGIGMAALPAAILASGLADSLRRKRDDLRDEFQRAIADGGIDAEEEAALEALRKRLGLSREDAALIRTETLRTRRCTCPECGAVFDPQPR